MSDSESPPTGQAPWPDEFGVLYRLHLSALIRFAHRLGATWDEAADIAQESFVRLYLNWEEVRQPGKWIRSVATDLHSGTWIRDRPATRFQAWDGWMDGPGVGLSDEEGVVYGTISQLPLTQRQVLAWCYDGYPAKEFAEVLGISAAAARASLFRARDAVIGVSSRPPETRTQSADAQLDAWLSRIDNRVDQALRAVVDGDAGLDAVAAEAARRRPVPGTGPQFPPEFQPEFPPDRGEPDLAWHESDLTRRRIAMHSAAVDRIGATLDLGVTCEEIAEFTVREELSDLSIVDVVPQLTPQTMHRSAFACRPELRGTFSARFALGKPVRPAADSLAARSMSAGAPLVANLLSEAELEAVAASAEDLADYRAADVDSVLAVPLWVRGEPVGVLTLARVRGGSKGFGDDEIVLVEDLARRAAVSVANARQYAESQQTALELQRALLVEPGRPHANLDVAARYLPSGSRNLIGGDWYEIVRLSFGRTLLVLGDVMGHGVEAAVDMSNYRSIIRDMGGMDLPPRGILGHLDTVIANDESARPATCLLAVADPNRGRWTLASAGHLPPALFAADRPTKLITIPNGPPLGTGVGGYEQVTVDLLPDQVMLLYTDGLVERRGEDIDTSLARLAAVALPASGEPEDLLDTVLGALDSPAGDDDIALVAARIHRR